MTSPAAASSTSSSAARPHSQPFISLNSDDHPNVPPPAQQPRRRAFGAQAQASQSGPGPQAKPNGGRPSSAGSSSSSFRASSPNTNNLLAPQPVLATQQQAASGLNGSGSGPGSGSGSGPYGVDHRRSSSFTADGVNKAQAWLSTWAPRGEGRGRAFVSNTLYGVAGVASQVGQELNGALGKQFGVHVGSPNSTPGPRASSPGGGMAAGVGSSPVGGQLQGGWQNAVTTSPSPPPLNSSTSDIGASPPMDRSTARSPPGPTHTSSTPALPTSKRILQPANMSRLGPSSSPSPPLQPSSSNPGNLNTPNVHRPSMSHPTTSTSLPQISQPPSVHGPSHLNPRVGSPSHPAGPPNDARAHGRSPSFGAVGTANTLAPASTGNLSRSNSQATGGLSMTGRGAGMPYKIGFQPAGVKYDRTEDFMAERKRIGEEMEKVEGRLTRRWIKLVDLHFNPTIIPPAMTQPPSLPRSSSSSFSLASDSEKRRSLMSIDGAIDALKGPKEVWRGVKNNLDPRGGPAAEDIRKRAAEQTIVKWQDDADVKKCFICLSSFSLSNRKHHCRLCGRIVCALQPTPPALLAVQSQLLNNPPPSPSTYSSSTPLPPGMRREKCSLLLVADWRTGRGEEVDEGFVGWMKLKDDSVGGEGSEGGIRRGRKSSISSIRSASTSGSSPKKLNGIGGPLPQQPREVQVKGVRACRECWATVSRKQKIADRQRVSGFARLYQALRSLQSDIEDMMPEFEEFMDILSSSEEISDPGSQVVQLHKGLLDLLAQYELLSKRISSLPSDEGSSQATVQSAIARSAATFLAMQMVKLQALPRYQKRLAEQKRQHINMAIVETTLADQLKIEGETLGEPKVDDAAFALQPLLEQEAQLEVMIADAHAQRKYEDGKALSQALADIKAEIARVTQNAIM